MDKEKIGTAAILSGLVLSVLVGIKCDKTHRAIHKAAWGHVPFKDKALYVATRGGMSLAFIGAVMTVGHFLAESDHDRKSAAKELGHIISDVFDGIREMLSK